MATSIQVKTSAQTDDYEIVIEPDLLRSLVKRSDQYALDVQSETQHVIVTNTHVGALYGNFLKSILPNSELILVPDGEQYKTLETVSSLYREFARLHVSRKGSKIVALGGGVIGDMAGFAASTYLRGIPFVQVPTSLLSMVDSSVGGKVGVDLPQGKNLVGAFYNPEIVWIDTRVLQTLPDVQWRCGMAEVIKHGLLADTTLLNPELWTLERADELVTRAVQVKVNVVQIDPYEDGIRAHLNLGHTFGHAIEQVSGYRWFHGEAVGVGLVAAALLSHRIGLCGANVPKEVQRLVEEIGLPTSIGVLDPKEIYRAMAWDKKWVWHKKQPRFVLLEDIGKPTIVDNVSEADVIAVLETLQ